MNISQDILEQQVPQDTMPTRLDSALILYTTVEHNSEAEILTYNINPTTWNCLYPFYEMNHKFTVNDFSFSGKNPTYGQLIEEYQQVYKTFYEENGGWTKDRRKATLIDEFVKTFGLNCATISTELTPIYELKFSKTKNVWTLYYFENYVVGTVDNLNTLLQQTLYEQKYLPLDANIAEIDGITVASNVPYLLSIKDNVKKLNQNVLH